MKINNKYLVLFSLNFFVNFIGVFLKYFLNINSIVIGIVMLLSLIIIVIKEFKNNIIFTPVIISIVCDISFDFYIMNLVKTFYQMNFAGALTVILSSFLWKLISLKSLNSEKIEVYTDNNNEFINSKFDGNFKFVITVLFLVSVFCMFFEWYKAGGIPIIRKDSETFRFSVSYSPITHILAIMNKIVASIIGVYLVFKQKISLKKDFILILEMIISELLVVGTAMRGEFIMAPVTIFIAWALKKELSKKYFLILILIFLFIIGIIPLYRMINVYGISYINSLKSISEIPSLYFLTPLYQSFANNYSILALDFSIFPNLIPFGLGEYSILSKLPFIDIGKSVMQIQNDVLNNNFYAGLTGTYMASWYADFGYFGCFLSSAIYSWYVNYTFKLYNRKRGLFTLILYIYTLYSGLWLFYNSTFDVVYFIYVVLLFFIIKIRIK